MPFCFSSRFFVSTLAVGACLTAIDARGEERGQAELALAAAAEAHLAWQEPVEPARSILLPPLAYKTYYTLQRRGWLPQRSVEDAGAKEMHALKTRNTLERKGAAEWGSGFESPSALLLLPPLVSKNYFTLKRRFQSHEAIAQAQSAQPALPAVAALPQMEPADLLNRVYETPDIEIVYVTPDTPAIPESALGRLEAQLCATADAYYGPDEGSHKTEPVNLTELSRSGKSLSWKALSTISGAILSYYQESGVEDLRVEIDPNQINERGEDLRAEPSQPLRLIVRPRHPFDD